MAESGSIPPYLVMRDLLMGACKAQAIYAAASLGLADRIEQEGPQAPAALATATGTQAGPLYRLLRALASLGIFAEDSQGRFGLTPLAECLLSNRPGSQRALALMKGEEHYRCWGELLHSVKTGQTAFEHLYHQPVFAYLAEHPRAAAIFDEAMTGVHGNETGAMIDAYDFSGIGTLVDVGGGNGGLLMAVLERYPSLGGILFDRADVIARARTRLEAAGLLDRCRLAEGSFFEAVPAGGDAYLMRHIIHDWTDEQCQTILRCCRQVLPPHGKLLIVETVIPAGNDPSFAKLLDLTMLAMPGGKERTEAEYRRLLSQAGFRLQRIVPTQADIHVIESVPG
jgi:ubiquinone/menaquinone biosynthesis C-methylase UbiE